MKALTMIFLSIFLAKSCDTQLNEEMKKANIEYQALSRGYFLNVNIQNDKLTIIDKRDGAPREYKLTNKDWKDLANLYKMIKLEELSKLKSPTEKRFYDGAPIAGLRVIYEGKTYETPSFDHGYPPAEIEAFIKKIVSFATPQTNGN